MDRPREVRRRRVVGWGEDAGGGGAGRTLPDSTLALAGDGCSSVIRGSVGRDDVNTQKRRVTGHASRVCVDGERGGGGERKGARGGRLSLDSTSKQQRVQQSRSGSVSSEAGLA